MHGHCKDASCESDEYKSAIYVDYGYDRNQLAQAIWTIVMQEYKDNGSETNFIFWNPSWT